METHSTGMEMSTSATTKVTNHNRHQKEDVRRHEGSENGIKKTLETTMTSDSLSISRSKSQPA